MFNIYNVWVISKLPTEINIPKIFLDTSLSATVRGCLCESLDGIMNGINNNNNNDNNDNNNSNNNNNSKSNNNNNKKNNSNDNIMKSLFSVG